MTDFTSSERTFPDLAAPPHVVTATGPNGITPFVWDPTDKKNVGAWASVDQGSGIASLHGTVTSAFPDTGKWLQT